MKKRERIAALRRRRDWLYSMAGRRNDFERAEYSALSWAIQELGRTHPECVDPGDASHPIMSRGLDLPTGVGIVGVREKQGGGR